MFLFCLVFAMSLCASVYMCFVVTCWERADLLALVCGVYCEFVTFPLVSWVRCGTCLYRFLIFVPLLTFILSCRMWSLHRFGIFLAILTSTMSPVEGKLTVTNSGPKLQYTLKRYFRFLIKSILN